MTIYNLLADTHAPEVLASEGDPSVNHVWSFGEGQALEARFVRRTDDYFIVYLSSQTGCNQSCRFCHLTATGQTSFEQSSVQDFARQAREVFAHYSQEVAAGRQPRAQRVHFNWMARGEPLLSPAMLESPEAVLAELRAQAQALGLQPRFNISTIFPKDTPLAAVEKLAAQPDVQLYYSLYSLEPRFRKRWLPKAHAPGDVLPWLAAVQAREGTLVALHWAVIDGENDDASAVEAAAAAVAESGLKAKFNLVRYNPFSAAQGKEASEQAIQTTFSIMSKAGSRPQDSRVVPRVGFDVKASCGMFVQAD